MLKREYMERRAQFTGDLSNMKWTLGIIQSARQRDGHSCGAFVMMNALAVVKGVDPTKLGNKAAAMRVYVQHQLLENSISPKQPLRICDMLTCALSPVRQHKDEPWVRCDVCGRWLHLKCVALEKPPPAEDDYVCPVCLAQYH